MKTKKILILLAIINSLLVVSIGLVSAFEENDLILDGVGDVVDFNGEIINSNKYIDIRNIDFTELGYSIDNNNIEVTVKVNGKIDNRGNINDAFGESTSGDENSINFDFVIYSIIITFSNDEYTIFYINETCILSHGMEEKNLTSYNVNGNSLTISFEANVEEKSLESIIATSEFSKININYEDLFELWSNMTPEELAAQNKSKQETVLANRIRGVAYRLKRKGLLTSPSIGVFKIASKGLAILKNL